MIAKSHFYPHNDSHSWNSWCRTWWGPYCSKFPGMQVPLSPTFIVIITVDAIQWGASEPVLLDSHRQLFDKQQWSMWWNVASICKIQILSQVAPSISSILSCRMQKFKRTQFRVCIGPVIEVDIRGKSMDGWFSNTLFPNTCLKTCDFPSPFFHKVVGLLVFSTHERSSQSYYWQRGSTA